MKISSKNFSKISFSFLFALLFVFAMFSVVIAAPRHSIDFSGKKQYVLAVVPYVYMNLSGEENAGYVLDNLKSGYTEYFAKNGFMVVSDDNIATALAEAEYSASDNVIISEEGLKSIAEKTNADIALAMEVEEISTGWENGFLDARVTARVKLHYEVYKKSDDKIYQFRIATARQSQSALGDTGKKSAIENALKQALERGNNKLIEIINKK